MEEKCVQKFNNLSIQELAEFASALRTGVYSVVTCKQEAGSVPEGIIKEFITRPSYQYILADPEAGFECFALAFPSGRASVSIPMGVYGVTAANGVYFPLQLNSIWRAFIMMSLDEFGALCGAVDSASKFSLLLEVREALIRSIFSYYYNLGERLDSVMAWAARSSVSLTRRLAECAGFSRIEFGDMNNRSEMYSAKGFQGRERYLMGCNSRWEETFKESQRRNTSPSNVILPIEKLAMFYGNLLS